MYPSALAASRTVLRHGILDVVVISVNPAIEVSQCRGVATLSFNTIESPQPVLAARFVSSTLQLQLTVDTSPAPFEEDMALKYM